MLILTNHRQVFWWCHHYTVWTPAPGEYQPTTMLLTYGFVKTEYTAIWIEPWCNTTESTTFQVLIRCPKYNMCFQWRVPFLLFAACFCFWKTKWLHLTHGLETLNNCCHLCSLSPYEWMDILKTKDKTKCSKITAHGLVCTCLIGHLILYRPTTTSANWTHQSCLPNQILDQLLENVISTNYHTKFILSIRVGGRQ